MKRPLLFGCICLTAVIAIWMYCFDAPPFYGDIPVEEGASVTVTGQIYQKEQRSQYGTEQTNLYLRSIQIIHSDTGHVSNLNPKYIIICEINTEQMNIAAEGELYSESIDIAEKTLQGTIQGIPELGRAVQISGEWQLYEHASNPGQFDPADYYYTQNIVGKVNGAVIRSQGQDYWPLREYLYQLRNQLTSRLYQALPEKEASILAKMLLGENSGLDTEVKELYQRNGIVHILSISGLHITIVGMGIYRLLRRCSCPIFPAAFGGIVFLLLYGAMTGFGISACRAIGMYLIRMLSEIIGRSYDMLTALGVLMAVMVCHNPRLLFHCGFLLSFGSVCAVGCLYPILPLQDVAVRKRAVPPPFIFRVLMKRFGGLIKSLWASASISLFTLPIMLYFFYEVPVYAPLVNLLVLPFMSLVMLFGFILMVIPEIPLLADFEHIIFSGFERVCLLFEELPGHTWVEGRPETWQILAYYVLLLAIIRLCNHGSHKWAVGLMVPLLLLGGDFTKQDTVAFLDVGQGDCIVVMTRTGNTYLFDGGSSSEKNISENVIEPFLKYYGISHIEGAFISHPDEDHVNGIIQLLERGAVSIDTIFLPDVDENCKADYQDILSAVSGQKVIYYAAGDFLKDGKLQISCLHPYAGFGGESNTYSGCFVLENEEIRILLTGDVEGEGEVLLTAALQEKGIERVQVLKTAHHGSKYSTEDAFLKAVSPQLAVISCGEDNMYGHPHEELLQRFEAAAVPYCITYERGCITVTEEGYSFYKR